MGLNGVFVSLSAPGFFTTTSTDGSGAFHFDDLAPGTYQVTPLGVDLINPGPLTVEITSGEEETATTGVQLEPGQFETLNEDLCFQVVPDNDPPVVTEVKAGSSQWTDGTQFPFNNFNGYVDPVDGLGYEIPTGTATVPYATAPSTQSTPLPWENINKLYVEFNEDVVPPVGGWANPGVVALFDSTNTPVPVSNISYDPGNFRLSITTTSFLGDDRYLLAIDDTVTDTGGAALDGEFANGSDTLFSNLGTSGDGNAGNKFEFTFNVQHGDASGSATVDVTDLQDFGNAFGSTTGNVAPTPNYNPFSDFNGSGSVDVTDLQIFGVNFGDSLLGVPNPSNPLFLQASNNSAAVDSIFAADDDDDEDDMLDQITQGRRARQPGRFV